MMSPPPAAIVKPAPLQAGAGEVKPPRCCGHEMNVLLRRAVLHSDGSVDFQSVWSCALCGRRIL